MDDLFQYLIYGIIIFSFLSSFFKKKEPPKQTPAPKKRDDVSLSSGDPLSQTLSKEGVKVANKQDEFEILKELENLFKGDFKIPEPPKPKPSENVDYYKSHEIKDKDLNLTEDKRFNRDVTDRKPIGYRQTFDEKVSDRKNLSGSQSRAVDPKIEEGSKTFERVLAGPRKQRAAITEFNKKLKNPRTVKEYILFSEILGKPKALRR